MLRVFTHSFSSFTSHALCSLAPPHSLRLPFLITPSLACSARRCRTYSVAIGVSLTLFALTLLVLLGVLVLAIATVVRHWKSNTEKDVACCKLKMMPQLLVIVTHELLMGMMVSMGIHTHSMGFVGGADGGAVAHAHGAGVMDIWNGYSILGVFLPLLVLLTILVLLGVSISWAQVVGNVKAFRSMTPASVKRRARIFVGTVAAFMFLTTLLFNVVLRNDTLSAGCTLVACLVIIISYLYAACRLQQLFAGKLILPSASPPPKSTTTDEPGSDSSLQKKGKRDSWTAETNGYTGQTEDIRKDKEAAAAAEEKYKKKAKKAVPLRRKNSAFEQPIKIIVRLLSVLLSPAPHAATPIPTLHK